MLEPHELELKLLGCHYIQLEVKCKHANLVVQGERIWALRNVYGAGALFQGWSQLFLYWFSDTSWNLINLCNFQVWWLPVWVQDGTWKSILEKWGSKVHVKVQSLSPPNLEAWACCALDKLCAELSFTWTGIISSVTILKRIENLTCNPLQNYTSPNIGDVSF